MPLLPNYFTVKLRAILTPTLLWLNKASDAATMSIRFELSASRLNGGRFWKSI